MLWMKGSFLSQSKRQMGMILQILSRVRIRFLLLIQLNRPLVRLRVAILLLCMVRTSKKE